MNNRGSILIITTAFVFGFTALGLASIYLAGQENQFAQREALLAKAFWLADGAVEQARDKLTSGSIPVGGYSSGTIYTNSTSSYNYTITGTDPYTAIAIGTVRGYSRTIKSIIENFNGITHNTAVVYSGPQPQFTNTMQQGNLPYAYSQNVNLSAQLVFGTSLANVEALASSSNTHVNGDGWSGGSVSGITVFKTTANDTAVTLNNITSSSAALLIIDTSASTTTPLISLTADKNSPDFNGVIYVLGNLDEGKNVLLDGAVYVQGNLSFHDNGSGNAGIVDGNSAHIASVGSLLNSNLYINSWQECKNTACT